MMKRILVTGAAGFIGFHLSRRLLEEGTTIVGIDNLNDYYDVNLKKARLAILKKYDNFIFHKVNIANRKAMESLFGGQLRIQNSELETRGSSVTRHASRVTGSFDTVIHLAAQAGIAASTTGGWRHCSGRASPLRGPPRAWTVQSFQVGP